MCVHPVAEEIDEHEHEKREGVAAVVQPGQHQEQPRRRAAVRHHVQHRAEPRGWRWQEGCFVFVYASVFVIIDCVSRLNNEKSAVAQNGKRFLKAIFLCLCSFVACLFVF